MAGLFEFIPVMVGMQSLKNLSPHGVKLKRFLFCVALEIL